MRRPDLGRKRRTRNWRDGYHWIEEIRRLSVRPIVVFLVEDNGADVYLVKYALQQHGVEFELVHAKDGDSAVQMVRRIGTDVARPDIILVDMNLPRRTGVEVLAAVRGQPACKGVPVIVMTSSDSPDDRQRAADFAVDWYFRKPSDLAGFVQLGGIVKAVLLKGDATAARTS